MIIKLLPVLNLYVSCGCQCIYIHTHTHISASYGKEKPVETQKVEIEDQDRQIYNELGKGILFQYDNQHNVIRSPKLQEKKKVIISLDW